MNQYEALYIIDNSIDDAAKEAAVAKYEGIVTNNGGTVEKSDRWGTKRYAYPINFKNEGYYVLMTFQGVSALPKELERQMGNADEIIRYMVIRKG